MSLILIKKISILVLLTFVSGFINAANRIDTQRPDAPLWAAYGDFKVGVRKLDFVIPNQLDVVNVSAESDPQNLPTYDRPLTVEVWYPADANETGDSAIKTYMRDGKIPITLVGKGIRDADPTDGEAKFPLVIISHGYPGNRFLLAHLAENIASKGYVVASIDHTDSTYRTLATFGSTLINRPLDQEATLEHIAKLADTQESFLHGLVNTENSALIGFSMGGYGALITAGAGVNPAIVNTPLAPPLGLLSQHTNSDQTQQKRPDSRFKTIITFAPWGKNYHVWEASSLAQITLPTLLISGSVDDVSGYESGVRAIWQQMTGATRALLTFENANHSAGAPMPAPQESFVFDQDLGMYISEHYTDPVWDNVRMNNISQHFITAWLGKYLKQDDEVATYLDLEPHSKDGVWSMDEDAKPTKEHTFWKGFENRTAAGLRYEVLEKAP